MISDFNATVGFQFGIQLKRNEISDVYCKGGLCYKDDYDAKNQIWVAKPGNTDMTLNSFGYAFRAIGREDFTHNLNGLTEQIQYANAGFSLPLLSDSNAMGSGQLGNVGRLLDYYEFAETDLRLATQQLQTLSLLGMPLTGFKLQNPKLEGN